MIVSLTEDAQIQWTERSLNFKGNLSSHVVSVNVEVWEEAYSISLAVKMKVTVSLIGFSFEVCYLNVWTIWEFLIFSCSCNCIWVCIWMTVNSCSSEFPRWLEKIRIRRKNGIEKGHSMKRWRPKDHNKSFRLHLHYSRYIWKLCLRFKRSRPHKLF